MIILWIRVGKDKNGEKKEGDNPLRKDIAELGIPDLKDREILYLTYNAGPSSLLHLDENKN